MTRAEDTIEIDAPAARAFEVMADPRHLPRIDRTATVRLLSGDWTEVGSRHHVTNRIGGVTADSVHEITRFEPPVLLEERITTGGTSMAVVGEVRPMGDDRCAIVVRSEIDWGGSFSEALSRLLHPLVGPPRRRRELRHLKRAIETWDGSVPQPEAHLGEER